MRKKIAYFLLIFFITSVVSCNEHEIDVKNEEMLSKAYDYLLGPNNQGNIIRKDGEVKDVKGFRNLVFNKILQDYNKLLPEKEKATLIDTVLNVKLNTLMFSRDEYLEKYPLKNVPISYIILTFLNDELVRINIYVPSRNIPGGYQFTSEEKTKTLDFFNSAYGNYLKECFLSDEGSCTCSSFEKCYIASFPTTIVEYKHTYNSYNLIFTKRDKRDLLKNVEDTRDNLARHKQFEEYLKKIEEKANAEKEKIKREL